MRQMGIELAWTLALMLATASVLVVLVHFCLEEGRHGWQGFLNSSWDFLSNGHLDREHRPLIAAFCAGLGRTGPMLVLAVGILTCLAVSSGSLIAVFPKWDGLRMVVLVTSALPAFLLPVMGQGLVPNWNPFAGSEYERIVIAALALAIGDANWFSVLYVFTERLRLELSRPHVRLLQAIGRQAAWEVWPRALIVVLEAVGNRVPHLIGGTIALEFLLNIDGLGNLAFRAIVDTPPDYHAVLWVCLFGIVVTRVVQLTTAGCRAWLLPESTQSAIVDDDVEQDVEPENRREVASGSAVHTNPAEVVELDWPAISTSHFENDVPPLPRWIPSLLIRLRWYLRVNRYHVVNLSATLLLTWGALLALAVLCTVQVNRIPSGSGVVHQAANSLHWLGTDGNGDDILLNLAIGLRQQWLPMLLALGVAMLGAPAALAVPFAALLPQSSWSYGLQLLTRLCDGCAELLESIPKAVIMLAGITLFSHERLILKMFLLMGVVHSAGLYRALKHDLMPVSRAVFLEGMRLVGIPLHSIVYRNLILNHAGPALLVQCAVITANFVHLDALLGYVGIRNRGEIHTWGMLLGMGLDEWQQNQGLISAQLIQFNSAVVSGPLLFVWLSIVAALAAADAAKLVFGGTLRRIQ